MAANQSKERILAGAKELFLARGYSATTVDAICEKAGLTKGSFYYFFDSKEDLGLAVLDWSLRRSTQMLASASYARILDPLEKAFAFLEHLEKCSPEIWSGGCLLGSFSLELADTNSRMQQAVSGMFQAVADDFAKQLQPIEAQCPGSRRRQLTSSPIRFWAFSRVPSYSPKPIAIRPAFPRPSEHFDSHWLR